MNLRDLAHLGWGSIRGHRLRSALTALGIAVGVAAVVLLTSIGEGTQRFVLAEFTQFGTHLVAVTPGRTTTHGLPGAILGTIRPLTVEDADALRRVRGVVSTVPVVQGNVEVSTGNRSRRTTILGVGADMPRVWQFQVRLGRFLPPDDARAARALAVLGARMRRELFGDENPLGARIRVGSDRYRVIGALEEKGQVLGFDLDDTVYIPAGRALDLFDREGVMEIDVLYSAGTPATDVVAGIRRVLTARHAREDFTCTTQQEMLDVLGSILGVLTFAVGALGGISLLVGGVGILTVMMIAVTERTAEIGLLRALGATRGQVLTLFLAEAVALAALGGLAGLLAGAGIGLAANLLVPALPVHTSWLFALLAEVVAASIGLAAGVLPARRAARLDPIEALRAE
ncbi:MAG: ABC transporter permease [Acidobacteria bacterium]|nr:ABC transporter permease [Acidobacteriota bacterium]